jgi:hypothetical protein
MISEEICENYEKRQKKHSDMNCDENVTKKANGIKEIQCNETNKNLMKYIKKHEKI